jgi:DNA-binding winged helix-turn-helix (wHTH) protein
VKEFGVLEALMRDTLAFLSAENLLEQVWDEHADPFTNAVLITISRLRRKLGEPAVIETRPGVGYRITEPGTGTWPGRRRSAAAALTLEVHSCMPTSGRRSRCGMAHRSPSCRACR